MERPDQSERRVNGLVRLLDGLMALTLLMMMLLTFVDVLGRYVFNKPVFGSTEMTGFLLAICLFSGMAVVSGMKRHITVSLFETQLDRYMPGFRHLLVQAVSLGVLLLFGFELFRSAGRMLELRTATTVLEWPQWPLAVTGGCMLWLGALLLLLRWQSPTGGAHE
ncbi:MAG: TRAP transporter small permease [Thiothrix sp.]|nr:TRAP transporter small permease [Thiothrix sp.]HPE62192.1 TRAP transporter small permease [Thiolinea sp.]